MPVFRFVIQITFYALLLLRPFDGAVAATIAGTAGNPENPENAKCLEPFQTVPPSGPLGDSGYGLINMCSHPVTIVLPVLLHKHRGELTVKVFALGSAGADLGVACRLRSKGAKDDDLITGSEQKTEGKKPSIQSITLKLKRVYDPGFTGAVCRLDAATGVVAYEY